MEMEIVVDKNTFKNLEALKDKLGDGLLKGVRNAMFFAEGASKKRFGTTGNLNVLSGRLRSSIKTDVRRMGNEIIGTIGSNVIYAKVHELGLGNMPARPFLRPAIDENINMINSIIIDSINKEVK